MKKNSINPDRIEQEMKAYGLQYVAVDLVIGDVSGNVRKKIVYIMSDIDHVIEFKLGVTDETKFEEANRVYGKSIREILESYTYQMLFGNNGNEKVMSIKSNVDTEPQETEYLDD